MNARWLAARHQAKRWSWTARGIHACRRDAHDDHQEDLSRDGRRRQAGKLGGAERTPPLDLRGMEETGRQDHH